MLSTFCVHISGSFFSTNADFCGCLGRPATGSHQEASSAYDSTPTHLSGDLKRAHVLMHVCPAMSRCLHSSKVAHQHRGTPLTQIRLQQNKPYLRQPSFGWGQVFRVRRNRGSCNRAALSMAPAEETLQATYPPPDHLKDAHVESREAYDKLYAQSLKDPEAFWGKIADEFHWHKRWSSPFHR